MGVHRDDCLALARKLIDMPGVSPMTDGADIQEGRPRAATSENRLISNIYRVLELTMSGKFSLTMLSHGAFGALTTLTLMGQPPRRFTSREASIVARAIAAVALGTSPERQIFMSPIASDHDFDARVVEGGLVLVCTGSPQFFIAWPDALELSKALKEAAGEE